MSVINKMKWRYATKKFDTNRKLENEKIEIIKEAFNLTATSFGLQTISMIVVSDKDIRKKLVEYSFFQNQVIDASHLLVLCIQRSISDNDVDKHFDNVRAIRNTPEHILSPYRKDLKQTLTNMSQKERQQWSKNQAYIALGNLMTVCAIEDIDSCPMEGFVSKAYDEILNLEVLNLKSVLLLPVGYRDENDMFASFKKVRKQLKDTVIEM